MAMLSVFLGMRWSQPCWQVAAALGRDRFDCVSE